MKIDLRNENNTTTICDLFEKKDYVDVVVTTPPSILCGRSKKKERHSLDMTSDEYAEYVGTMVTNLGTVLKKNGVILWNQHLLHECPLTFWEVVNTINKETDFMVADMIVWKKESADPESLNVHGLAHICEPILVICRKKEFNTYRINPKVNAINKNGDKYKENALNFFEATNNDGNCSLNDDTFSAEMCAKLLSIYADKDSVVYDPYMGTGSTAVACAMLGINRCIGSEISDEQVEYSKRRVHDYIMNQSCPSLFDDDDLF